MWCGVARFGSALAWLGSAGRGSVRFGLTRLDVVRFGLTRLGLWCMAGGWWRVACGFGCGLATFQEPMTMTFGHTGKPLSNNKKTRPNRPKKNTVKRKKTQKKTTKKNHGQTKDYEKRKWPMVFLTLTQFSLTVARCDHQNITECSSVQFEFQRVCRCVCCVSLAVVVAVPVVVCGCVRGRDVCAVWCVVWHAENPPRV